MKILKINSIIAILTLATIVTTSCRSKKELVDIKGKNKTIAMAGYTMTDDANEAGTKMIKVLYKWFAGIGKADDMQFAIEMAQREAYTNISRTLTNLVDDQARKSGLMNDAKVVKAVKATWKQVSKNILKGCGPYGEAVINENGNGTYTVLAKIGIRADLYKKMLRDATNNKPGNLSADELDDFIKLNQDIHNAAKD